LYLYVLMVSVLTQHTNGHKTKLSNKSIAHI
jgi:hypothetical protein